MGVAFRCAKDGFSGKLFGDYWPNATALSKTDCADCPAERPLTRPSATLSPTGRGETKKVAMLAQSFPSPPPLPLGEVPTGCGG